MASIKSHLRNPGIPIDAHVGARCQALAHALEPRTAVYLDFRFWVTVREVREGIRTAPSDLKLAHYLKQLVRRGRVFCPISVTVFSELMKVGNAERRDATIAVVEELSTGVTLMPEEDRLEAEAEDIVLGSLILGGARSPRRVWTRLAYVLGNIHVADTAFSPETERAIQKAFFDHLWEMPLSAIAENLDPQAYDMRDEMEGLAGRLNAGNKAHSAEMKSFEGVLADEMGGVAELAEPVLRRVIGRMHRSDSASVLDRTPDRIGLNLLRAILLGEHAHRLPTLHVHASLQALFRWEYRDKLITGNDMFDVGHAAAALAYCDAFFTERELAKSVTHRRLKLDKRHDCFVTNSTIDAIAFLKALT